MDTHVAGTDDKMDCPVVDRYVLDEFRMAVHRAGKNDLIIQIPYLEKIADGYLQRYRHTNHWTDALRAHACYNSMSFRYRSQRYSDTWRKKAFQVQREFMGEWCSLDYANSSSIIGDLENQLQQIRDILWKKLIALTPTITSIQPEKAMRDLEIKNYFRDVKSLSAEASESMIVFTKNLIRKCVETLTIVPPCAFSVVIIGSLARAESTPYSDLEYMFIVERDDPDTERYFEMLAVATYFFIGNLRETPLKSLSLPELDWFEDQQKSGFKFDGLGLNAGNIPTGNGRNHDRNKFILTPDQLLGKYKQILDNPTDDALQGDLTAMLTYTREAFRYGERSMLSIFLEKKAGLIPNEDRNNANARMLMNDIRKFNFRPTDQLRDKGFTLNVKHDLYRFPSMVIFDLSVVSGVVGPNSWDTLDALYKKSIISRIVYRSLCFLLASACFVRLCTYLHHDSQNQSISLLNSDYVVSYQSQLTSRPWVVPQNLFFKMCEFMLPIKVFMKNYSGSISYFRKMQLCDRTLRILMMALTFHYCSEHSKALEKIESLAIGQENRRSTSTTEQIINYLTNQSVRDKFLILDLLYVVGRSLYLNRKYKESLQCYQSLENYIKQLHSDGTGTDEYEREKLVAILCHAQDGAGNCYHRMGDNSAEHQYLLAIENNVLVRTKTGQGICQRRKAIKRLGVKKVANVADKQAFIFAELNLACCYQKRRAPKDKTKHDDFGKSEKHNLIALRYSAEAAAKHDNLDYYGNVINSPADSQKFSTNVANLKHRLRLKDPSQKVALSFRNLGSLYHTMSRYTLAEKHYHKSLEMFAGAYGRDAVHRDIADVHHLRGQNYQSMGHEKAAKACYERALSINRKAHAKEPCHPDITDIQRSINSLAS